MLLYNSTFENSYSTPFTNSPWLPLLILSLATQKHTPTTRTHLEESYDYIVVGAGTAGSVVAARLAEMDCVKVLLLEAGDSPPKLTEIPVIARYFTKTDLDWNITTQRQTYTAGGLVDESLTISAGKAIGGTGVFNGLQYVRGNKEDFNKWAENGATGWSFGEVLPYFKKLENNLNSKIVENGYHGDQGPVTVSNPPYESDLQTAVYEAAQNLGYKILDSNGPSQLGFYEMQSTTKKGQRVNTAKAYLVPNENNPNLHIVGRAFVKKILIEHQRAEGVEFHFGNRTRRVMATREVIVSAGTMNTPKILMLSGIGPRAELTKHKIPIKADLPVGANLQEHYGVLTDFELKNTIKPFGEKQSSDSSIWKYIWTKTGPLASISGVTNMAFLNNQGPKSPIDYPDYELYFGEGVHDVVKEKLRIKDDVHETVYGPYKDKPFYWCFSQLLHPKGRGSVTISSANPYDPPVVNPMYFANADDLEVVISGLRMCKKIGTSESLKKIGSKPFSTIYPGCEAHVGNDNKYFRCIASKVMVTCGHVVGTAKMGDPSDASTVVDPQLRVKTIEKLRVVDASVMPTIPSGNTNTPTIMIAEKASDIIKQTVTCRNKNDLPLT